MTCRGRGTSAWRSHHAPRDCTGPARRPPSRMSDLGSFGSWWIEPSRRGANCRPSRHRSDSRSRFLWRRRPDRVSVQLDRTDRRRWTASPGASPTRISGAPVGDDPDRPKSEPDSRIVETTDLAGCVGRGPRLAIDLGAPHLVATATLLVGSGGDAVRSAARAIARFAAAAHRGQCGDATSPTFPDSFSGL